jgi:DNA-directed RNA polymerase specialized sigma24 family protein
MDRSLVERAKRGDREAFQAVAFAISDRLFEVAHRILRDADAAGDALQIALVRIWRDLPSLADPDRVEAWAHAVLVRACQDQLRRDRRATQGLHRLPRESTIADPITMIGDREELERAFHRLNADQRRHRAAVLPRPDPAPDRRAAPGVGRNGPITCPLRQTSAAGGHRGGRAAHDRGDKPP